MIELFSGGILSLLPLPRLSLPPEKKRVQPEKPPRPDRLAKPAAALRDLYDSFFRGTAPEKPENPSVVFDRPVHPAGYLLAAELQRHLQRL